MAQAEPKSLQGSAMRLSAEAEAFVPGKLKGRNGFGSGTVSAPNLNAQQYGAGELPHYITSCYPFVNGDAANGLRGPTQWSGPGRPPIPNSGGYNRMPRPHTGNPMLNGGRLMGPQQHYPGRMVRPPNLSLFPPGPPPPIRQVPPHNVQNFGPQSSMSPSVPGPGYFPYNQQQGSQMPGWQPSQYAGDFVNSSVGMYNGSAGYNASAPVETSDTWSGSERSKSSERIRNKKKKDNMVSVGIQNEVGTMSAVHMGLINLSSPGRKKTRTRTIILMDAANQTDFAEDIANLTLAEQPNSLYKRTRSRTRRTGELHEYTSTDSEEESDSGYSSPLHRRNQMSSGTHPAVSIVNESDSHGYSNGQNNMFSIKEPVNSQTVGYGNTGYTSPYVHESTGYQTVPSSFYVSSNANSTEGLNNALHKTEVGTELEGAAGKKKRRKNKRKKKKLGLDDSAALSDGHIGLYHAQSSSNVSRTSGEAAGYETLDTLHFEDEEEFPGLQSASFAQNTPAAPAASLSYSQIVKSTSQQPASNLSQGLSQEYMLPKTDTGSHTSAHSAITSQASKESKNAKKRRKRREMANRAAEEEMAEISLEQQVLIEQIKQQKQLQQQTEPKKKQAVKAGEKTKAAVSLNIGDLLDAFEKQKEQKQVEAIKKASPKSNVTTANPLDASAPLKRGKERETPKPKKPSPLKKVILKEREERKRSRLLDDTTLLTPPSAAVSNAPSIMSMPGIGIESDLSQDGSKTSRDETETVASNPGSAELSPISQTSPISMSPLTPGGSPLSSGVNSPVAANAVLRETKTSSLAMKIHSRRFREYCNQILEKEIDTCCTALLQDLVRFQDRLYHKDPVKAKSKRRIVLGLREVTKHLKLRKIKCVVISPNLERIQSKGGLDEALNNIITMCQEQDIPFVFALGRRALGRACAKLVPVSVVGIFNYEGSEENFRSLMRLTEVARDAYREMVQLLEKEMQDNPHLRAGTMPAQLFAHMGHSRTPSACSAISFTSSILSEPISENYPHSEPETDSRGYEIIRSTEKDKVASAIVSIAEAGIKHSFNLTNRSTNQDDRSDSPNSSSFDQGGKNVIMESINDIDEGAEADTEDLNDNGHEKLDAVDESQCTNSESCPEESQDKAGDLPHIDSIHSSVVDLSAEILSQHSSKTLDLNTEALSTHSFKTAECTSAGNLSGEHTPGEKSRHQSGSRTDEEFSNQSQKVHHPGQDRVESWIAATQMQMENLKICENSSGAPEQGLEENSDSESITEETKS